MIDQPRIHAFLEIADVIAWTIRTREADVYT